MSDTERAQVESWYAAIYDDQSGRHVIKACLTKAIGLIPPPRINLFDSTTRTDHELVYVADGTQSSIASVFGVSQQTIGRWINGEDGSE